jgi:UDP-3-O-[3-hydroxymyristoyl] N-acetylglucosamine deacetylase / 3-hydroxyacyl-[acyl-carrier-protein] dehydratase
LSDSFNAGQQHTLGFEIAISGNGLHSGLPAEMKLIPAAPGFGVQFCRVDLPGRPLIKADCDLVTDTFRATTLTDNGASVSAVEHILAALAGLGVDNCLIETDAVEIPSIDGSCDVFVELILGAGIPEQPASKTWYTLDTHIRSENKEKNTALEAFPDTEYSLSTEIDFKNPILGIQTAAIRGMRGFQQEVAPCRTFCFVHELDMLLENQLIKGDIVKKAILVLDRPVSHQQLQDLAREFGVDKFGVKNDSYLDNLELRFDNEIARHKLLDMIGDLSLVGFPIKAHIKGYRQGHASNNEFARKVKSYIKKNKLALQTAR